MFLANRVAIGTPRLQKTFNKKRTTTTANDHGLSVHKKMHKSKPGKVGKADCKEEDDGRGFDTEKCPDEASVTRW
jgi:hypothetical protein